MIAMQYSIVLPADYDMSIIDRRIAEKGALTDGFPGLLFKAYLSTRKAGGQVPECENLYAPFYLWKSSEGMNSFLAGPGFAGLTQSFGWPSVKTWSVWHAELSSRLPSTRFATRESIAIAPYTKLGELQAAESMRAKELVTHRGAVAAVAGFDPTHWSMVYFALWDDLPPKQERQGVPIYSVGHISTS